MKILFIIFGLAANLLFVTHVSAAPTMVHSHSIEVVVDCVDEALEAIQRLGGHNINMNVSTVPMWGREPIRRADVTRRVNASEYRWAQQLIRSLGTVTFESESARNVEQSINDLRLRINSADGEFGRISQMMAESDNLTTLIMLDSRLSEIAWTRDNMIGSLNALMAESGTALLTIHLAEEMGVFVPPPEPTFYERITSSFFGSLLFMRNTFANFTVFVAYALIPAIILSLFALIAFKLARRILKFAVLPWQKTGAEPITIPESEKICHVVGCKETGPEDE